MAAEDVTAVVLCGGGARRFGADKLAQRLGATTVIDTLLDALPSGWPIVAVGPTRETTRTVTWVCEDPPGGGPLAGLAAGAAHAQTDVLVAVAGDMPFAGPWTVRLAGALGATEVDAVAARDATGRLNPLLAAYRRMPLWHALPPDPAGRPARTLLDALSHTGLDVPEADLLDVDTPGRLAAARRRVRA